MNPKLILTTLALSTTLFAANDSPQWRGPHRDGIFPATGLLQQWPAAGPKLAWKTEKLGKGMNMGLEVHGKVSAAAEKGWGHGLVVGAFVIAHSGSPRTPETGTT